MDCDNAFFEWNPIGLLTTGFKPIEQTGKETEMEWLVGSHFPIPKKENPFYKE